MGQREPGRHHGPRRHRKIVLCFDGTGNKFSGDDSDSNILKIYRMLDRTARDQYHYYQPGIGTYVVSNHLSPTGSIARLKSWYMKAKDSAIGSSFDHHVVGGYRFLMRFYNPGDEIYIFGFSRGAYIARFLAEMLDYIGLLSHGNEEMVFFAWKAFSNWQSRQGNNSPEGLAKKKEMYQFMKDFRETFSRPVRRIRFLGLFDTVNSVPRFEAAWMQRSKFPYTARTSAKVIRHAVSVDERRAKFRQDLIYQSDRSKGKSATPVKDKLHDMTDKYRKSIEHGARGRHPTLAVPEDPAPYRRRSRSARSLGSRATGRSPEPGQMPHDGQSEYSVVVPHPHGDGDESDSMASEDSDEHDQDIDEVWFSGGHGDIGGGWDLVPGSKAASHIPLVWMVREAMKAGLTFDPVKLRDMGCVEALDDMGSGPAQQPGQEASEDGAEIWHNAEAQPVPEIMVRSASTPKLFQNSFSLKGEEPSKETETSQPAASEDPNTEKPALPLTFHEIIHQCHSALIHDSLQFDCGLHWGTVLSWKLMEYLPFKRMDLAEDGSWKPIRWPLPRGEVRDMPANARVHGSVIRRMELNEKYRPGNLIFGGGGRGVRVAPTEAWNPDDWECVAEKGDPVGEIWVRKSALGKSNGPQPTQ